MTRKTSSTNNTVSRRLGDPLDYSLDYEYEAGSVRRASRIGTRYLRLYHYAGNNPLKYTDPDGNDFRLFGYRTNIREVINAIFHFVAAFKIFANHNKAESFAKESDLEGQSGGARDAYRHIVWSALNTRDVGEKTTKKFTDAHEASTEQNSSDRAMDIYNNEIGREIGNIPNITDDEIKVKAHEAVKAAEIPKEGVKAAAVKPLPSINGPYEYGKGVEDVK